MIKGSKQTEDARRKMSESHKKWELEHKGEKKTYSEERIKKMGEAQKRLWANPEYRRKMSEIHKGKPSRMKGKNYPEEIKIKMSLAQKKRFANPEARKKQSEALKGRKAWNKGKKGVYSEEQIQRMKESHKGQIAWNKGLTKETDIRMKRVSEHISSIGGFNRGKSSWIKGKHPSKETIEKQKGTYKKTLLAHPEIREKISLALRGRKLSETQKRALLKALTGRKLSEESREKIRKGNLGRKRSEETKKRIGMSQMGKTPWNLGIPPSKEQIEKRNETIRKLWLENPDLREKQSQISRATLLRLYESGSFPHQTNTKPERQIKEELLKRGYQEGIDFIHQYKFMNKFMCDFCFPKQKLIIEVDGDFWHANPNKYPVGSSLHPHQIKDMWRDKAKNAYITKVDHGSWTLLRFWESEIKKDVAKCVDRIEEVLREKNKK